MSEFTKFLDGIIGEELAGTHTAILARVERYDPVKSIADVMPLASGQPPITNAPVVCFKSGGFIIRFPLKKGDIVLAVVVDHAVDQVMASGQPATPDSLRKHDLSDAVVIGGLTMFNQPLPGEHGQDLVIAKDDMTLKIVISEDAITIGSKDKDINLTTQEGNINISSVNGNVNISGKDKSDSW